MTTGTKTPTFAEYARIHLKVDVQAAIRPVSERRLRGMVFNRAGLAAKHKLLGIARGNRSRVRSWAALDGRTQAERAVGRNYWVQWSEIVKTLEGQIKTIDEFTKERNQNGML